jgi:hypothetical protein
VSETAAQPQRTPLETGVLITLVTLGLAAVLGFIAVVDADDVGTGFGTGLGIAATIFLVGGTIACCLACLRRGRAEIIALGSIAAAGVAIDMAALGIWRTIDNEAYGKIAGIAFVWSFFALVILGLTLAVGSPTDLARSLYIGAVVSTIAAASISAWLIATAGTGVSAFSEGGAAPYGVTGDDELLRALGASLVLLAAFWFGALAASRLRPSEPNVTR